jgi:diguanylate cyclase (GGDEF)-like protein
VGPAPDPAQLPVVPYEVIPGEPPRFRWIGPQVEDLLGFPRERWLREGGLWRHLVAEHDRTLAAHTEPGDVTYRMTDAYGRQLVVRDIRTEAVAEDGTRVLVGVVMEAADRDHVTGLPRREVLLEHLALAAARARETDQRVALLTVGLEGFGLVTSTLGDRAGDAVLREATQRLAATVRDTTVLARADGARFCVMLDGLDGSAGRVAELVGGQLITALHRPFSVDGSSFTLAPSIGISVLGDDADDEQALVRHADGAQQEAARTDTPRLVFYAGATSENLQRLLVTARLERAIERSELRLHYQPIVDVDSGRVVAVEALVRWQDPDRGLIGPMEFIPLAEYTGLITDIGDWVLAEAFRQVHEWQAQGLRLGINVNVSLRQFRDDAFGDRVQRALRRAALDPQLLTLEITESTAMREPECVEPVLERLRALGVRVAIDDFGTGHSSLGRLRHIAVHDLKLDRELLRAVPEDDMARRLVAATLTLVECLGMRPIAEGVETPEQHAFLRERGCTLAQGFHLGRPVEPERIAELAR